MARKRSKWEANEDGLCEICSVNESITTMDGQAVCSRCATKIRKSMRRAKDKYNEEEIEYDDGLSGRVY